MLRTPNREFPDNQADNYQHAFNAPIVYWEFTTSHTSNELAFYQWRRNA